jgi:hypothetical protein
MKTFELTTKEGIFFLKEFASHAAFNFRLMEAKSVNDTNFLPYCVTSCMEKRANFATRKNSS